MGDRRLSPLLDPMKFIKYCRSFQLYIISSSPSKKLYSKCAPTYILNTKKLIKPFLVTFNEMFFTIYILLNQLNNICVLLILNNNILQ